MEHDYVLQMNQIGKEYSGHTVLKDVSLKLKRGEIHALLGENGAGKSTLMNILFGMNVIHSTGGYDGSILINGEKTDIDTPNKAMECGIGMVHQEFMLIPGFTVVENIKLGREISKPTLASKIFGKSLETLDMEKMAEDAKTALNKVGLTIDEYAKVAGMPVGYMQFVEIAREIDKTGIKVLVFDEPTAVLTESEAQRLMEAMRVIADSGIAIIFITHRLDEVMEICDNITILRDGELVRNVKKTETSIAQLAEMMVGRKIDSVFHKKNVSDENRDIALQLKDFYVYMNGEEVKGLNLDVYQGEIFGIGGLAGQGKIGVCNGIMGIFEAEGQASVFGKDINFDVLGDALRHQVAFVSEDRKRIGLLLDQSIAQNIVFTDMQVNNSFLHNFGFFKLLNKGKVKEYANQMIEELDIRCTSQRQAVGNLSGGNQQKVCLARALTLNPKLLLVAEPTRGIDIGAKNLVLEKLVHLNQEEGMTIIIVSSELAELRSVCDRIAIITDGKLSKILKPDDSDVNFGLAMSSVLMEKEGDLQ